MLPGLWSQLTHSLQEQKKSDAAAHRHGNEQLPAATHPGHTAGARSDRIINVLVAINDNDED